MAKRIGVKDLAREAGVSISTVSHVLNRTAPISAPVRARVLRAAETLGYLNGQRARLLNSALQRVLIAVPPHGLEHSESNTFISGILSGINHYCSEKLITLIPYSPLSGDLDGEKVIEAAVTKSVDAIILLHDDRPELLAPFSDRGEGIPPVVLVNGEDAEMAMDSVSPQNRFAARLATRSLTRLGHRRILHVTWQGRATIARRKDGFLDAMSEVGIGKNDAFILSLDAWDLSLARSVLDDQLVPLVRNNGITAIFSSADSIALYAMKNLQQGGVRVPEDVSIIGFDNLSQGEISLPRLSSVDVPLSEIGPTALSLLETRVANAHHDRRPLQRIELACQLIHRDSVAPPL